MRRTTSMRTLVAGLVVTALVGASATVASATEDPTEATADLVQQVAPDQGTVVAGVPHPDGTSVQGEGVETIAPESPDEPITMTTTDDGVDTATLEVSLPVEADVEDAQAADDGTLVYSGDGRDDVDVAVQLIDDGSARIQTIIPSAEAPTQYTYDVQIGSGGTVQLVDTGGAVFLNSAGELAGGAAPPWAKDANGNEVPHLVLDRRHQPGPARRHQQRDRLPGGR